MAQSTRQVAGDETVHYVAPRKARKQRGPPPRMQPPLTPMIDVVFQLLLFFLLGTTFRQEEGLIVATLPEKGQSPGPAVKTKDITISLHPFGQKGGVQYAISDQNISITDDGSGQPAAYTAADGLCEELKKYRDQFKLNTKDSSVIIRPDGDVRWQYVVEAFNQAVRAQFEKIAFAPS